MTLFITGSGSGIGKETTLLALHHNHTVISLLRNNTHKQQLLSEARGYSGKLHIIHTDLSIPNSYNSIPNYLKEKNITQIDALLNIAGTLALVPLNHFNEETIKETLQVNFIAPAMIIKILLPFLQKSCQANILNISSMAGYQGSHKFPNLSIYGASKAALNALSESLATELSPHNIHINSLAIGAVNTKMLQTAFPNYHATISTKQMANYILQFATKSFQLHNGKIIPVAISNP